MGTAVRADSRSDSGSITRIRILSLLAILAVALAVGVFDHDIWSPTEPTVAGVVAGMVRTGDLAVPRIHGFAYLEKPPLYYGSAWIAARLTGRFDAGILRLPSALFGLASLALLWRTSRRFHGEGIAWACALLPSLDAAKSYRPLFDEIRGTLDGRKLYTAIRDDRYLPLADYYFGRGLELVEDERDLVDRLRSPERVGLILTASRLREEDALLADVPHRALCASRGKRDLVLVINR